MGRVGSMIKWTQKLNDNEQDKTEGEGMRGTSVPGCSEFNCQPKKPESDPFHFLNQTPRGGQRLQWAMWEPLQISNGSNKDRGKSWTVTANAPRCFSTDSSIIVSWMHLIHSGTHGLYSPRQTFLQDFRLCLWETVTHPGVRISQLIHADQLRFSRTSWSAERFPVPKHGCWFRL